MKTISESNDQLIEQIKSEVERLNDKGMFYYEGVIKVLDGFKSKEQPANKQKPGTVICTINNIDVNLHGKCDKCINYNDLNFDCTTCTDNFNKFKFDGLLCDKCKNRALLGCDCKNGSNFKQI